MSSATLMGTTRLGLVRPGGGDGESLLDVCDIFSPFPILMGSDDLPIGLVGSKADGKGGRPVFSSIPCSGSGSSGVMWSESVRQSKRGGDLRCSVVKPLTIFP